MVDDSGVLEVEGAGLRNLEARRRLSICQMMAMHPTGRDSPVSASKSTQSSSSMSSVMIHLTALEIVVCVIWSVHCNHHHRHLCHRFNITHLTG